MKKLFLLLTLPLLALSFTACDKGDDDGNGGGANAKLVKTIVSSFSDGSDGWTINYVYDNQQRITRINATSTSGSTDHSTVTYGNNTATVHFEDGDYQITYDNNGYAVKDQWDDEVLTTYEYSNGFLSKVIDSDDYEYTYTWSNGNIVKVVEKYGTQTNTTTYTYTDVENKLNVGIFYINGIYFSDEGLKTKGAFSRFLPLKETDSDGNTETYSYIYDGDGFPTEITTTSNNGSRTQRITYY